MKLWPDNSLALYGLAKFAVASGDSAAATSYYRTAIYSHDLTVYGTVPGDGCKTNDLLSQSPQDAEAQKVYKWAAHVLNYQDSQARGGKQFH